MTNIVLFRKELRQNAVIYGIPFVIILLVGIFNKNILQSLSNDWLSKLVVAVPLALAVSYGLQAFDLEENGQTRDFLLTRPLSVSQIIWNKYISGFIVLSFLSFFWIIALAPQKLQWPSLLNFQGCWFSAYILITLVVYTTSFTIGLLIKGPIKLLVAVLTCTLTLMWFLFTWLQFLTVLYLDASAAANPLGFVLIVCCTSLFLLVLFIIFSLKIAQWFLCNQNFDKLFHEMRSSLLFIFLLPLIFFLMNTQLNRPAILPFDSLFSSLFTEEKWFTAIDGTQNLQGTSYAVTDGENNLAIVRPSKKPKTIYSGTDSKNTNISAIVWSPQGENISFTENGLIKVVSILSKAVTPIASGNLSFWSNDGTQMLIAQKTGQQSQRSKNGFVLQIPRFKLIQIDFLQKKAKQLNGELSFPGRSMIWDSNHNQMIAVGDLWTLYLMDLSQGKTSSINLLSPGQTPELIFQSRIIRKTENNTYRIILYTTTQSLLKNKAYNLYIYEFNASRNFTNLVTVMKNLKYKYVLPQSAQNALLVSNGNGVFRQISVSKGGN